MAVFAVKTSFILSVLATTSVLNLSWRVSAQDASSPYDTDILILGAGTAGLNAAKILQQQTGPGFDFKILEGASQTGGVLQSVNFGGIDIPIGENWVYDTELDVVTAGIDIGSIPIDYDASYAVLNDEGRNVTDQADEYYYQLIAAEEFIETLIVEEERGDLPAKTALAMGGWVAYSPVSRITEWYDYDFAEGLPSKRISTIGMSQEYQYEHLITDLNQGLFPEVEATLNDDNLKLNAVVRNIDQSGDRVVVTLDNGEQYTANYVLMTFNVGVLQQGGVTFTPPLPPWKTEPIFNYQRSTIEHILLKFSSKFWGDEHITLHASDRPQDVDRQYYPAFLNYDVIAYPGSNILGAIVTGDEALRVESLTDEEIREEVLGVLRNMYGDENVSELEDMYFRRWASDPLHYGTFTTWPVPAYYPLDVTERLAAKVDRVYFAQQASSVAIGLLSGSIDASAEAMRSMITCIDSGECDDYVPVDGRNGDGNETNEEEEEEEELYGCVRIPKKEGKTRKNRASSSPVIV